jgi:pimeloyl-ACP methyl ester carboxylesterase
MAAKTFVLVHGAWHGGWCWKFLRDSLTLQGHRVFTPSLTGLGERSHLMSRNITLDTHALDIANLIRFEDLHDVCLVGHSYGGWPVSAALELISDRVSSVVFLDAFVPRDGQKGIDTQSPESAASVHAALARGDVARKGPRAAAFGVLPQYQAWVDAMMTPQPLGVSFTPIKLTGARERVARKTYIRATRYPQPTFDQHLTECRAAGWTCHSLDVGHDVMVDAPEALAAILSEA